MQKIISRGLYGLLFAGGITLLGATAANAADTTGEDGIASGNLIDAPIAVPVTIDGNAISLIGDSAVGGGGSDASAAAPRASAEDTAATNGEDGIGSGNVVSPDVTAPVSVTGNSITLVGDSVTAGSAGSDSGATPVVPADDRAITTGEDGLASGNLISPDATAPVDVTGNAIALLSGAVILESTESSAPGAAEASDDGVVREGRLLPLFASPTVIEAGAGAAVGDQGEGASAGTADPDATDPDPSAVALTPREAAAAETAGAVLASSTTPTVSVLAQTGTNPAELILLALALMFGGATAGLLWRVNRGW